MNALSTLARKALRATIQRSSAVLVLAAAALLAGCASPITAKVTSFNQWPADAAGASFSYIVAADKAGDLEQVAYQGYVQAELEKRGLKRAATGQVGRFQVDIATGHGTRDRKFREPIYQDYYTFRPPYRDAAGNVYPGFWMPDPFGSRYVGDREVVRTTQVSDLQVRLFDTRSGSPGKPQAVFESRAVYEGDNEDLAALVPYLVKAAFDGFPGQNGGVRMVKFDRKSGDIVKP
jgi:Domain of unknown function (DUF4136)